MLPSYFNSFSLLIIEKSRFFSLTCKPDRQTETRMPFWMFLYISQVKHHSNPLTMLVLSTFSLVPGSLLFSPMSLPASLNGIPCYPSPQNTLHVL